MMINNKSLPLLIVLMIIILITIVSPPSFVKSIPVNCDGGGVDTTLLATDFAVWTQTCHPNNYYNPQKFAFTGPGNALQGNFTRWTKLYLTPDYNTTFIWENAGFRNTADTNPQCEGIHIDNNSTNTELIRVKIDSSWVEAVLGECNNFDLVVHSQTPIILDFQLLNTKLPGRIDIRAPLRPESQIKIINSEVKFGVFAEGPYMPFEIRNSKVHQGGFFVASRPPKISRNGEPQWDNTSALIPWLPYYSYSGNPDDYPTLGPQRLSFECYDSTIDVEEYTHEISFQGNASTILLDNCNMSFTGSTPPSTPVLRVFASTSIVQQSQISDFNIASDSSFPLNNTWEREGFNFLMNSPSKISKMITVLTGVMNSKDDKTIRNFIFDRTLFTGVAEAPHVAIVPMKPFGQQNGVIHSPFFATVNFTRCYFGTAANIYMGQWNGGAAAINQIDVNIDTSVVRKIRYIACSEGPTCDARGTHKFNVAGTFLNEFNTVGLVSPQLQIDFDFISGQLLGSTTTSLVLANSSTRTMVSTLKASFTNMSDNSNVVSVSCNFGSCSDTQIDNLVLFFGDSAWITSGLFPIPAQKKFEITLHNASAALGTTTSWNIHANSPADHIIEFGYGADLNHSFSIQAPMNTNKIIPLRFKMIESILSAAFSIDCVPESSSRFVSSFLFERVSIIESGFVDLADTNTASSTFQKTAPVLVQFSSIALLSPTAALALLRDRRTGHFNPFKLEILNSNFESFQTYSASVPLRRGSLYELSNNVATQMSAAENWNSITISLTNCNIDGSFSTLAGWIATTTPVTLRPRFEMSETSLNFDLPNTTAAGAPVIINNFPQGGSISITGSNSHTTKNFVNLTCNYNIAPQAAKDVAFVRGIMPEEIIISKNIEFNFNSAVDVMGTFVTDTTATTVSEITRYKTFKALDGVRINLNSTEMCFFFVGPTVPSLVHFLRSTVNIKAARVSNLRQTYTHQTTFTGVNSTVVVENSFFNFETPQCDPTAAGCGAGLWGTDGYAQIGQNIIINASMITISSSNVSGLFYNFAGVSENDEQRTEYYEISGGSVVTLTGTSTFAGLFFGRSTFNDTVSVNILSGSKLTISSTDALLAEPATSSFPFFKSPNSSAHAFMHLGGSQISYTINGGSEVRFDLGGAGWVQPRGGSLIVVNGNYTWQNIFGAGIENQIDKFSLVTNNAKFFQDDSRSFDVSLGKPQMVGGLLAAGTNITLVEYNIKSTTTAFTSSNDITVFSFSRIETIKGDATNNNNFHATAPYNVMHTTVSRVNKATFNMWNSKITLESTATSIPATWLASSQSSGENRLFTMVVPFHINRIDFAQAAPRFNFDIHYANSNVFLKANLGSIVTAGLFGEFGGCNATGEWSQGKFGFFDSTLDIDSPGSPSEPLNYHGLAGNYNSPMGSPSQCPITFDAERSTINITNPNPGLVQYSGVLAIDGASIQRARMIEMKFYSAENDGLIIPFVRATGASTIFRAISNFSIFNFTKNGGAQNATVQIEDPGSSEILRVSMDGNHLYGPALTPSGQYVEPRLVQPNYNSGAVINGDPYLACNSFNDTIMELNETSSGGTVIFYNNSGCLTPTTSTTTTTTMTNTSTTTSTTEVNTSTTAPETNITETFSPLPSSTDNSSTTTVTSLGSSSSSSSPINDTSSTTTTLLTNATTNASTPLLTTPTVLSSTTTATPTSTTTSRTSTTFSSTTTTTTTSIPITNPPAAQQAAQNSAVAATAIGASISTAVPSPATAVLASRLGMIGKISECSTRLNVSLEFYESPFDVKIQFTDSVAAQEVAFHLGGLISNMGILIAWGSISLIVGAIHNLYKTKVGRPVRWSASQAVGRFPSSLMFPLLFFSQPFFGSAITVMLFGDTAATIVAAMIMITVIALLGIMIASITSKARFMATFRSKVDLDVYEELQLDKAEPDGIDKCMGFIDDVVLGTQGEWFDIPYKLQKMEDPQAEAEKLPVMELKKSPSTYYCTSFGGLFDCYRGGRQWYIALDFGAAVILGIGDGLIASFGCDFAGAILVSLFALYFISLLILRPMCTRFETVMSIITSFLQLCAASIAVASAGADPNSAASQAVASVSTAALMVGTVQALTMAILDGFKWLVENGKSCFKKRAAKKKARQEELRHQREEEELEYASGGGSRGAGRQFEFGHNLAEEEMEQIANDRDEAARLDAMQMNNTYQDGDVAEPLLNHNQGKRDSIFDTVALHMGGLEQPTNNNNHASASTFGGIAYSPENSYRVDDNWDQKSPGRNSDFSPSHSDDFANMPSTSNYDINNNQYAESTTAPLIVTSNDDDDDNESETKKKKPAVIVDPYSGKVISNGEDDDDEYNNDDDENSALDISSGYGYAGTNADQTARLLRSMEGGQYGGGSSTDLKLSEKDRLRLEDLKKMKMAQRGQGVDSKEVAASEMNLGGGSTMIAKNIGVSKKNNNKQKEQRNSDDDNL